MEREVRFFSIGQQSIAQTKHVIESICNKQGWDVDFMDFDYDNTITGQINESIQERYSSDYLTLLVREENYSKSWGSVENLKAYHEQACFYILEIEVFY